ncbi:SRPBCC family protein [Pseudoxanthomonas japonensis]|uniref:SRPBCC family protein n=1 Tax=Pseudoxanthomonas japonensis TaxID=69284 RepID=UPI001EE45AA5|nr:SRPBCC family protein [Pseudoxanthomonas japonensis]
MKRLLGIVLLAVTALAAPAHAEVRDAKPDGFTVENSVWVPATPQVAYAALVNDVGRWWPADHTWWGDASKLSISDKAGGCFCELNGAQQAWHMTVTFTDPGKLLRMTGGLGPLQGMGLHGALEWRFVDEKGGTRITLWYRVGGYTPDDLGKFAPVVDKVQGVQLGGLAAFLRNGADGAPAG